MSLPKLPDNLPSLPAGAVYLGIGGTFALSPDAFDGWCSLGPGDIWYPRKCTGAGSILHYAAPADSDIARLNGHVCEPAKPACDSEAVALVRKLAEAIRTLRGPAMDEALKEAEAFLAREGTKS